METENGEVPIITFNNPTGFPGLISIESPPAYAAWRKRRLMFFDQLYSFNAIWALDHSSALSPQIAWAFFLSTSKAAVSARADSFRRSSWFSCLISRSF
jgi:hypothetical protein